MACGSSAEVAPAITADANIGWPEVLDIVGEFGGASDTFEVFDETLVSCVDDSECGDLDDGDLCNGLVLCMAGECKVDPATVIVCLAWADQCAGEVCVPDSGECEMSLAPAGTECDDGDPCSTKDQCLEGICSSLEFMSCDDGNPCTADNCQEGVCSSEAVEVSCEDGNPCTTGDLCVDGECSAGGELLDCDDNNPCTDDACSSVEGCIHQPNQKACEDGDPCTLGDQCTGGECITGPGLLNCDDNSPCTEESCVAMEGCVVVEDLTHCDDDDPCTIDICDGQSGCSHQLFECDGPCLEPTPAGSDCGCLPKNCDDQNPCTADECDGATGECVHVISTCDNLCLEPTPDGNDCGCLPKVCDDQDACTTDSCLPASGLCENVPLICDDDNPCTEDSCDPQEGECTYSMQALDGASCSDGDDCTDPDLCVAGECTSGPDVCTEDCDNGIDDDGDGAIDCADTGCLEADNCQEQECLIAAPLQCGFIAMSSLPGEGTGNLDSYPCSPHSYPGIERVYSFVSPCTGEVSFTVSVGMMGNIDTALDVMVLDEALGCKTSSCIAAGLMTGDFIKQAKVTFQAEQGKAYNLVVEGRDGNESSFTVTSLCSCFWGDN